VFPVVSRELFPVIGVPLTLSIQDEFASDVGAATGLFWASGAI
jgi:hypothetical protein